MNKKTLISIMESIKIVYARTVGAMVHDVYFFTKLNKEYTIII